MTFSMTSSLDPTGDDIQVGPKVLVFATRLCTVLYNRVNKAIDTREMLLYCWRRMLMLVSSPGIKTAR
jgi:hypothetical protein